MQKAIINPILLSPTKEDRIKEFHSSTEARLKIFHLPDIQKNIFYRCIETGKNSFSYLSLLDLKKVNLFFYKIINDFIITFLKAQYSVDAFPIISWSNNPEWDDIVKSNFLQDLILYTSIKSKTIEEPNDSSKRYIELFESNIVFLKTYWEKNGFHFYYNIKRKDFTIVLDTPSNKNLFVTKQTPAMAYLFAHFLSCYMGNLAKFNDFIKNDKSFETHLTSIEELINFLKDYEFYNLIPDIIRTFIQILSNNITSKGWKIVCNTILVFTLFAKKDLINFDQIALLAPKILKLIDRSDWQVKCHTVIFLKILTNQNLINPELITDSILEKLIKLLSEDIRVLQNTIFDFFTNLIIKSNPNVLPKIIKLYSETFNIIETRCRGYSQVIDAKKLISSNSLINGPFLFLKTLVEHNLLEQELITQLIEKTTTHFNKITHYDVEQIDFLTALLRQNSENLLLKNDLKKLTNNVLQRIAPFFWFSNSSNILNLLTLLIQIDCSDSIPINYQFYKTLKSCLNSESEEISNKANFVFENLKGKFSYWDNLNK